ncbi:hypothetical protein GEV41_03725 [Pseudomonas putida]|uniref:Uncharacterized protein n=1 Tax=Pseudomonas hunanensis TaxID=1247546 RepID=A0ACC9MZL5_9PSED|nr:hypothetical protein CQW32_13130 [Pseudomonas putida]PKF25449.1 hypothetical protein CW309_16945 [Pseudomonas hunanensis]QKL05592.1 hypothetical protein GEV41_03725 [Pseudomonas putida]
MTIQQGESIDDHAAQAPRRHTAAHRPQRHASLLPIFRYQAPACERQLAQSRVPFLENVAAAPTAATWACPVETPVTPSNPECSRAPAQPRLLE